jgi:hypothetical protein
MMTLLSFLLSVAGFAALALAMDRHRTRLPRRVNPGPWPLRAAGAALLCGALGCAIAVLGPATGFVLWTGLLTPAAVVVAVVLAAS